MFAQSEDWRGLSYPERESNKIGYKMPTPHDVSMRKPTVDR